MRIDSDTRIKGKLYIGDIPTTTATSFLTRKNGYIQEATIEAGEENWSRISSISWEGTGVVTMSSSLQIGSYNGVLEMEFGNHSNSNYRLAAKRIVDFSFSVYQSGMFGIHSISDLRLRAHSGTIVNVLNGAVSTVLPQDIDIDNRIASNRLEIVITNKVSVQGSITCNYLLKLKRLDFSGIIIDSNE